MSERHARGAGPRLLLVSSEFPPGPGGIGTHAHQLALGLGARGWEVRVLATQPYVDDAARAAFRAAQPFRMETLAGGGNRPSTWPGRIRAARRLLAGWRPEVVVGSGMRALWLARALAALYRAPLATVAHGSELLAKGLPLRLTRGALSAAGLTVSVSRYTEALVEAAGARPRHGVVIPNGADGDRFAPGPVPAELRARLGLEGRRVIVTVGRVCERKAQDVVIRALPHLPGDVVYLMVGLPEIRADLERLAAELGVAERVRFAGAVGAADLPLHYRLGDVFCLLSRRASNGDVEGYGIVALEAALCGVPAVVSGGSGLAEAVADGETGFVVPPDDPEAAAAALGRVLEEPGLRDEMGRRALAWGRARTWARRVDEYDRLLRALHARPGAAPVGETAGWAA